MPVHACLAVPSRTHDQADDNAQVMGQAGNATAHLSDCAAEAVKDFDAAIGLMPLYGDAWKRRGQAKNALEDLDGASKVRSQLSAGVHVPSPVRLAVGRAYTLCCKHKTCSWACGPAVHSRAAAPRLDGAWLQDLSRARSL